ncbi:MAG: hypothetical protein ACRC2T_20435, partial [Thermoguttaceae bacterium]
MPFCSIKFLFKKALVTVFVFCVTLLCVTTSEAAQVMYTNEAASLGGRTFSGNPAPRENYGMFGPRSMTSPWVRDNSKSRFSGNGVLYDQLGRPIGYN